MYLGAAHLLTAALGPIFKLGHNVQVLTCAMPCSHAEPPACTPSAGCEIPNHQQAGPAKSRGPPANPLQ